MPRLEPRPRRRREEEEEPGVPRDPKPGEPTPAPTLPAPTPRVDRRLTGISLGEAAAFWAVERESNQILPSEVAVALALSKIRERELKKATRVLARHYDLPPEMQFDPSSFVNPRTGKPIPLGQAQRIIGFVENEYLGGLLDRISDEQPDTFRRLLPDGDLPKRTKVQGRKQVSPRRVSEIMKTFLPLGADRLNTLEALSAAARIAAAGQVPTGRLRKNIAAAKDLPELSPLEIIFTAAEAAANGYTIPGGVEFLAYRHPDVAQELLRAQGARTLDTAEEKAEQLEQQAQEVEGKNPLIASSLRQEAAQVRAGHIKPSAAPDSDVEKAAAEAAAAGEGLGIPIASVGSVAAALGSPSDQERREKKIQGEIDSVDQVAKDLAELKASQEEGFGGWVGDVLGGAWNTLDTVIFRAPSSGVRLASAIPDASIAQNPDAFEDAWDDAKDIFWGRKTYGQFLAEEWGFPGWASITADLAIGLAGPAAVSAPVKAARGARLFNRAKALKTMNRLTSGKPMARFGGKGFDEVILEAAQADDPAQFALRLEQAGATTFGTPGIDPTVGGIIFNHVRAYKGVRTAAEIKGEINATLKAMWNPAVGRTELLDKILLAERTSNDYWRTASSIAAPDQVVSEAMRSGRLVDDGLKRMRGWLETIESTRGRLGFAPEVPHFSTLHALRLMGREALGGDTPFARWWRAMAAHPTRGGIHIDVPGANPVKKLQGNLRLYRLSDDEVQRAGLEFGAAIASTAPNRELIIENTIKKWMGRGLKRSAEKYGFRGQSLDEIERLVEETASRGTARLARAEQPTFGVVPKGGGVDELIREPFLPTQLRNWYPIIDPVHARTALSNARGYVRGLKASLGKALGREVGINPAKHITLPRALRAGRELLVHDLFMSWWKPLVVIRPAYVLRVPALDERMRFYATLGPMARLEGKRSTGTIGSWIDEVLPGKPASTTFKMELPAGETTITQAWPRPGSIADDVPEAALAGGRYEGITAGAGFQRFGKARKTTFTPDDGKEYIEQLAGDLRNQFAQHPLGNLYLRGIAAGKTEDAIVSEALEFVRRNKHLRERLMGMRATGVKRPPGIVAFRGQQVGAQRRGAGIFFSESEDVARGYSDSPFLDLHGDRELIAARLKVKNPKELGLREGMAVDDAAIARLKSAGHDSAFYLDSRGNKNWVVFDENQFELIPLERARPQWIRGSSDEQLEIIVRQGVGVAREYTGAARGYADAQRLAALSADTLADPANLRAMLARMPDEFRPSLIHGESAAHAMGAAQRNRYVDRLADLILKKPTNAWNRAPYFRKQSQVAERAMLEAVEESGKSITPAMRQAIKREADDFAILQVNRIMFDFRDQARLGEIISHVVPFFQPYTEAFVAWGRIIRQNPAVVGYLPLVEDAMNASGIIKEDPRTGERVINMGFMYPVLNYLALPIAEQLTGSDLPKFGDGLKLSSVLTSWNLFISSAAQFPTGDVAGEVTVPTPGLAPPLMFGLQQLVEADSGPFANMSATARARLAGWAFQYGESDIGSLAPAWVSNILAGLGAPWLEDRINSRAADFLVRQEILGEKADPELAKKQARGLTMFTAFLNAFVGGQSLVEFDHAPLEDEWQTLLGRVRGGEMTRDEAQSQFLRRHPGARLVLETKTVVGEGESPFPVGGDVITDAFLKHPNVKTFAKHNPEWLWAVIPDEVQGDFDISAYFAQLARELRRTKAPEEFLHVADMAKAWDTRTTFREFFDAMVAKYPDLGENDPEYIALKEKYYDLPWAEALEEFSPEVRRAMGEIDISLLDPDVLQKTRNLTNNAPLFRKTEVGKAFADYFEERDKIAAIMRENNIRSIDTVGAADLGLTERYEKLVEGLRERSKDFSTAYFTFNFDKDLRAEPNFVERAIKNEKISDDQLTQAIAYRTERERLSDRLPLARNSDELGRIFLEIRRLDREAMEDQTYAKGYAPTDLWWRSLRPDEQANIKRGLMARPYAFLSTFERKNILGEKTNATAEDAWEFYAEKQVEISEWADHMEKAGEKPDTSGQYAALNAEMARRAKKNPALARQIAHANDWTWGAETLLPDLTGRQSKPYWDAFVKVLGQVQDVVDAYDLHGDLDPDYRVYRDYMEGYKDALAEASRHFKREWNELEEENGLDFLMETFVPPVYFPIGAGGASAGGGGGKNIIPDGKGPVLQRAARRSGTAHIGGRELWEWRGMRLAAAPMRSILHASEELGRPIRATDTYRTAGTQARAAAEKPGLAAAQGSSLHEQGLAIDIHTGFLQDNPRVVGILERMGWHRFDPQREPWHFSWKRVG